MGPLIYVIGLLITAPDSAADDRLLAAARTASVAQDFEAVDAHLFGWATLKARPAPPAGFPRRGSIAISQADQAGRLALFVSRVGPRLRVGLNDPARLVGRLEAVWVDAEGQETPLVVAEEPIGGRTEFRAPRTDIAGYAKVRAVMTFGGAPIVLKEAVLQAQTEAVLPPTAPVAPPPAPVVEATPQPAEATSSGVPWWWIAAGVVAASLVGAAAWQETR